jgi:hypothetical protein
MPGVASRKDSDAELAEVVAPAVREYIAGICAPKASRAAVADALARIARVNGYRHADGTATERVREAARAAALEQAGRASRGPSMRLRHIARGRFGHTKVPRLLHQRMAGQATAADLRWLYRTLEHCPDCGRLAARLDAAEWSLKLALAEVEHARPDHGTAPRAAGPAARVATSTVITHAALSADRIAANGLATDRVAVNGLASDRVAVNGLAADRLRVNGRAKGHAAVNGSANRRVAVNGLASDRLAVNGLATRVLEAPPPTRRRSNGARATGRSRRPPRSSGPSVARRRVRVAAAAGTALVAVCAFAALGGFGVGGHPRTPSGSGRLLTLTQPATAGPAQPGSKATGDDRDLILGGSAPGHGPS